MRITSLALASLVLLGGLVLLVRATRESPTTPVTTVVSGTRSQPRTAAPVPEYRAVQALPAHTLADVEKHERELAVRARSTRTLERADMMQLHATIDSLGLGEAARLRAHRELSARLRALAGELERAPVDAELTRLFAAIQAQPPGAARDGLVASYRLTARTLPPLYRSDALAKLR